MKKRKKISKTYIPNFSKKTSSFLTVFMAVGLLCVGNWFAHQSRDFRASFGCFESFFESVGSLTSGFTDVIGVTGKDAFVVYEADVPYGPLPFGMPEVVQPQITPDDQQILKRKGYWTAWSPSLRVPLWSAYAVPTKKIVEHAWERPATFDYDKEAKNSPSHSDYTGSNYDRGHMAPNHVIATRYGRSAQKETFLMSNIAPQKADLNRHAWRKLEEKVADDLSSLGETIWVITGIVPDQTKKTLRKGAVHVPKGFYKIIASVRDKRLYAIGIYMPQETAKRKNPRYCFYSIDEIEALTGLDFFPNLSKIRQAELESVEVTRFWSRGIF